MKSIQITALGALLFFSGSALAISESTDDKHQAQRFLASHFNQFNAQHALDMITQTPGFVLQEGSTQRGLANTSGNVLINGIAVQSKTQSLSDILAKLSLDQVEYIDFYQANHPFSSASQHTQVINIKVNNASTTIDVQSSLALRDSKRAVTGLDAQIRSPWLNWQHQLSIKARNNRYESNYIADEYTQQGMLLEQQTEDFIEQLGEFQLGTQSTMATDTSNLQLTSQFWTERWQTDFIHAYFEPNSAAAYDNSHTLEWLDMDEYQLGVDWQTTVYDSFELQLTALVTDNQQAKTITELNVQAEPFIQNKHHKEHAVQLSIQAKDWYFEPQWGLEFSHNQLQANTHSANQVVYNQVSETRYQPFGAINWQINDAWQLYSKLNVEFATLNTHTHDANEHSKRHIKPLLRLSYDTEHWNINWQFKQHVEQLDFALFVVSQDISFDRVQLGNNNIKPSRYSELSMQLNYATSEYVTINSKVFRQWQRDIHESMQLNDSNEGIANAGRAHLNGLDAVIDLKTDVLLANSTLSLDYQYRQARYHDPLGGIRAINELTPHTLSAEFRHNYDTLSWGIELSARTRETQYYVAEKSLERDSASTSIFFEMPLASKTQLRIEANAVEKEKTQYLRQFYQPTRAGKLDGYQITNETTQSELRLTLRSQL
ncbi:hypothetical protein [Pseudoalteromonas sp. S16_S37]|uniref:hypothetical protein n=1 Tax=Pseudoalteromonas sp. S16_S37 TaxID=2720228 RepID=UPI00168175EC|nr:hypothetical protein [Pseudoalteromonas sp. S16_S37]MBD1583271.1 hypothetical protein [Pseudoalteromonas sp. S16_S37]